MPKLPKRKCKACLGVGKNSKGEKCSPCDGTGYRIYKKGMVNDFQKKKAGQKTKRKVVSRAKTLGQNAKKN